MESSSIGLKNECEKINKSMEDEVYLASKLISSCISGGIKYEFRNDRKEIIRNFTLWN